VLSRADALRSGAQPTRAKEDAAAREEIRRLIILWLFVNAVGTQEVVSASVRTGRTCFIAATCCAVAIRARAPPHKSTEIRTRAIVTRRALHYVPRASERE